MSPLFPIASLLPRQISLQIYQMYVQPHLDYCDSIFDCHLTAFDKSRLEKAQNRAARLITGTPRRTAAAGLRKELGWTSLLDRRRAHKVQLYHKIALDDRVPEFIKDIIRKTRNLEIDRNLRCTQSSPLNAPSQQSAQPPMRDLSSQQQQKSGTNYPTTYEANTAKNYLKRGCMHLPV